MYLDTPALKQWYRDERKKLEELPMFERESRLSFLNLQKRLNTEIKWDLASPETLVGRPFIVQHIKQLLFTDNANKHTISGMIDAISNKEKTALDAEWEKAFALDQNASSQLLSAYADFFLQLEKVNRIEAELKARGLDPERAYEEGKTS